MTLVFAAGAFFLLLTGCGLNAANSGAPIFCAAHASPLPQPSRLQAALPAERTPSGNNAQSVLFRTDLRRNGMLLIGLPALTPLWLVPQPCFSRMDALHQEKSDVEMTCDPAVPSSSGVAQLRAPDPSL